MWHSNHMHMQRKPTLRHTDALIPSFVSCIWKLLREKWRLPALAGNIFFFSDQWKRLLLGAGPHPGTLRLHSCLTAFKCGIWCPSTIVSPRTTLFSSRKKRPFNVSFIWREERKFEKWKLDAEKEPGSFFFLGGVIFSNPSLVSAVLTIWFSACEFGKQHHLCASL